MKSCQTPRGGAALERGTQEGKGRRKGKKRETNDKVNGLEATREGKKKRGKAVGLRD